VPVSCVLRVLSTLIVLHRSLLFTGGIGLNATALLAAAGMHDIVSSVDGAMYWPQDPLRERCLALLLVLLHNRRYVTIHITTVLTWLCTLRNVCRVDTVCYTLCSNSSAFPYQVPCMPVLVTQLILGAGAVISISCVATVYVLPLPILCMLCAHCSRIPCAAANNRSASIGAAARPNPFREAFGLLHDPTLHLLHRSASAKGNLVLQFHRTLVEGILYSYTLAEVALQWLIT
jgi:hypothetical protein